ncbi:hypothetical protein ABPG74_017757 [Tetrahymena malaccensis]
MSRLGNQSVEKEVDDQFPSIDEPLIQKISHNVQDINEKIISNEKWILYIKKQKYMQAEVQFLKNFCEAFQIDLQTKYVNCDSFSNIQIPCLKIKNYLIEKNNFNDLIYQVIIIYIIYILFNFSITSQIDWVIEFLIEINSFNLIYKGFCQAKNIQDTNTRKYYEYIISLMEKINMAAEYEMWYDQSTDYSYRSKYIQITQPLETLQNVYNYKLEKDAYKYFDIKNQADMIDRVKPLLADLEQSLHNIKYFKYNLDNSVGFCDIIVFSYLQAFFNNIPQSQLVRELDELSNIKKIYLAFTNIRKQFPIEDLKANSQQNCMLGEQKKENKQPKEGVAEKSQAGGGIAPKSQKQKIVSYCVVGAFTLMYLLGKQ